MNIEDMAPIPTVKIKTENHEGGYLIINESDFDTDTMELFDAPETPDQNSVVLRKKK